MNKNNDSIDPNDLPQKEVFKQKEVYQHPQPADQGKPLNNDEKKHEPGTKGKENEKTSKEAGLNEERSPGDAGAFEGFEDQR